MNIMFIYCVVCHDQSWHYEYSYPLLHARYMYGSVKKKKISPCVRVWDVKSSCSLYLPLGITTSLLSLHYGLCHHGYRSAPLSYRFFYSPHAHTHTLLHTRHTQHYPMTPTLATSLSQQLHHCGPRRPINLYTCTLGQVIYTFSFKCPLSVQTANHTHTMLSVCMESCFVCAFHCTSMYTHAVPTILE